MRVTLCKFSAKLLIDRVMPWLWCSAYRKKRKSWFG